MENVPQLPFTMSLSFPFYILQTDIPSGLLSDLYFMGGAEIAIKEVQITSAAWLDYEAISSEVSLVCGLCSQQWVKCIFKVLY